MILIFSLIFILLIILIATCFKRNGNNDNKLINSAIGGKKKKKKKKKKKNRKKKKKKGKNKKSKGSSSGSSVAASLPPVPPLPPPPPPPPSILDDLDISAMDENEIEKNARIYFSNKSHPIKYEDIFNYIIKNTKANNLNNIKSILDFYIANTKTATMEDIKKAKDKIKSALSAKSINMKDEGINLLLVNMFSGANNNIVNIADILNDQIKNILNIDISNSVEGMYNDNISKYQQYIVNNTQWPCMYCTYINHGSKNVCDSCSRSRAPLGPQVSPSPQGPLDLTTEWECGACTYINPNTISNCQICGNYPTPKEPQKDPTTTPEPNPSILIDEKFISLDGKKFNFNTASEIFNADPKKEDIANNTTYGLRKYYEIAFKKSTNSTLDSQNFIIDTVFKGTNWTFMTPRGDGLCSLNACLGVYISDDNIKLSTKVDNNLAINILTNGIMKMPNNNSRSINYRIGNETKTNIPQKIIFNDNGILLVETHLINDIPYINYKLFDDDISKYVKMEKIGDFNKIGIKKALNIFFSANRQVVDDLIFEIIHLGLQKKIIYISRNPLAIVKHKCQVEIYGREFSQAIIILRIDGSHFNLVGNIDNTEYSNFIKDNDIIEEIFADDNYLDINTLIKKYKLDKIAKLENTKFVLNEDLFDKIRDDTKIEFLKNQDMKYNNKGNLENPDDADKNRELILKNILILQNFCNHSN
jgi:hypothetical protein